MYKLNSQEPMDYTHSLTQAASFTLSLGASFVLVGDCAVVVGSSVCTSPVESAVVVVGAGAEPVLVVVVVLLVVLVVAAEDDEVEAGL